MVETVDWRDEIDEWIYEIIERNAPGKIDQVYQRSFLIIARIECTLERPHIKGFSCFMLDIGITCLFYQTLEGPATQADSDTKTIRINDEWSIDICDLGNQNLEDDMTGFGAI